MPMTKYSPLTIRLACLAVALCLNVAAGLAGAGDAFLKSDPIVAGLALIGLGFIEGAMLEITLYCNRFTARMIRGD